MHSPFLGELLGTMVLIILGDGVVAGVLLKDSKAAGAGWMAITTAWAFAVMCGIFVAIATGSKDAHLNPAVTVATLPPCPLMKKNCRNPCTASDCTTSRTTSISVLGRNVAEPAKPR